MLLLDHAITVRGHISLREEEDPKIIVSEISELMDNAEFEKTEREAAPPAKIEASVGIETPVTREAPVTREEPKAPSKLYLRVPSQDSLLYKKVCNFAEIFDGHVPLILYFMDSKSYFTTPHTVNVTPYLIRELETLLGKENVVFR